MHNYFAIETEAATRRQEWERVAAADARAAQASATSVSRTRRGLAFWNRFSASSTLHLAAERHQPAGALLELGRVPRPVAC